MTLTVLRSRPKPDRVCAVLALLLQKGLAVKFRGRTRADLEPVLGRRVCGP